DAGRAEDVAGSPEDYRDVRRDRDGLSVSMRPAEPQRRLRILDGVERQGRPMLRVPVSVSEPGLLLLQVRRIPQHHAEQRLRAGSAVDGAAKPLTGEQRQRAGMIDV